MPADTTTPMQPAAPPCEPCRTLLEALCTIGPQEQGWCQLRADVIGGRRDPAETIQTIFATADPDLLLRARDWVQSHD